MICNDCFYGRICKMWKCEREETRINAKNGVCKSFAEKSCVIELPCDCERLDKESQVLITYARNNMKVTKTAKTLKISRQTVYEYLKKAKEKYGLDPTNLFDLCIILNTKER